MDTQIKEYKNFGNVLFVSKGSLTLGFTLDIGPRIIYMSGTDGENIFFEDIDRNTAKVNTEMEAFFGKGHSWNLYGGHRIWLSPEKFPDTYHPDDEPIEYKVTEDTVCITGIITPGTKLQMQLEVIFTGENTLTVHNRVYNHSDKDITGSVWALSVMNGGGLAAVKQNDADTDLLHNRVLSVWSYTDLKDGRLFLGDKYITVKQSPYCKKPLKIAINDVFGRSACFIGGKMFEKRYAVDFSKPYPDNNVNSEIYTNRDFLELESLSPMQIITSGSYAEHTEHWTLYENVPCPASDDNELQSVFNKFNKH